MLENVQDPSAESLLLSARVNPRDIERHLHLRPTVSHQNFPTLPHR